MDLDISKKAILFLLFGFQILVFLFYKLDVLGGIWEQPRFQKLLRWKVQEQNILRRNTRDGLSPPRLNMSTSTTPTIIDTRNTDKTIIADILPDKHEVQEQKTLFLRRSISNGLSPSRVNITKSTALIFKAKNVQKKIVPEILPDINDNLFLLMLVLTTPDSFLRRHVIRTTWGGTHKQLKMNQSAVFHGEVIDMRVRLVFVVGRSWNSETNSKVQEEADKFGDILRVSLKETYRNIVYKVFAAYTWALSVDTLFVLKADHDVYVNVRELLSWLQMPLVPPLLYTGFIHSGTPVSRRKSNPHYVKRKDFRRRIFPDYCAGPCYVMSRSFLSRIISNAKRVNVFEVEDAYVGVLANRLGISPYHNEKFRWDRTLNDAGKVRQWSDDDLASYICLGDSLTTDVIYYLHYRYMRV